MSAIPRRPLGATGLEVSALGLGAGPLGDHALGDADAERLVRAAIELGVTVVDTAPSYGASEERVGRALRGARDRVVLVTKGGYGVPGVADWTPACIERGVDRALARLGTERIDVFLLHSCPLERLLRGDLVAPLERARRAGKVRAIGYAGDGDALAFAIGCGAFDVIECSVSYADQDALSQAIPAARARGVGVLAKRTLANAAGRFERRPAREDLGIYWDRLRALPELAPSGEAWSDAAIRFTAFAPGVDCALVGTTRHEHLARLARAVVTGPLPEARVAEARAAFASIGGGAWPGVV